jgi:hypothetical protein
MACAWYQIDRNQKLYKTDLQFCFLPVISQVKKKMREQVLVLLWVEGYTFPHQTHAVGLGFVEKKVLRIMAGTARI